LLLGVSLSEHSWANQQQSTKPRTHTSGYPVCGPVLVVPVRSRVQCRISIAAT